MLTIKKQLKKILGLTSIGIILAGVVVGIIVKDKNDSKVKSLQANNPETQTLQNSNTKTSRPKTICKDFFEKNEEESISKGYSKKDVVDCSFVGCGGIF